MEGAKDMGQRRMVRDKQVGEEVQVWMECWPFTCIIGLLGSPVQFLLLQAHRQIIITELCYRYHKALL